MDTGKIERAAVRAVEEYIDKSNKLVPYIDRNDKTPIWDGFIYIYKNEIINNNNFFARVPLQVKGTTVKRGNYYRLERKYIEGYKIERGTAFFMVQEKDNGPRVLYALLSSKDINSLLSQPNESIKINLKQVPANCLEFEKELFEFATKRNSEKVENPAPEEVKALMEGFEKMKVHLVEVEDKDARYDLESLLIAINELKNDGTVGWRDKFIYYSRKALDLAISHLKDHDYTGLQFKFGFYLYKQKQYHLVEDYYLNALKEFRERNDIANVAAVLNNLGNLHKKLTRYKEAEREFKESLEIRRELAKANRDTYIKYVADTLNNLAILHDAINHKEHAEQEYKEALEIYRELAKTNYETCIRDVADTLNNLACLHDELNYHEEAEQEYREALMIRRELAKKSHDNYIEDVAQTLNNLGLLHKNLNRNEEAELEYQEALKIHRELAETNHDAYIADVAMSLNNLAVLHDDLNRKEEAEQEYQEALNIRRELARTNRDVYTAEVARILNNLACLHDDLNCKEEAEHEFQEALRIRRELAKTNRDAYIEYVAVTLFNLGLFLQKDDKRLCEARDAANEALGIYKELAKKYPQIWSKDVEDTQELLEIINQTS